MIAQMILPSVSKLFGSLIAGEVDEANVWEVSLRERFHEVKWSEASLISQVLRYCKLDLSSADFVLNSIISSCNMIPEFSPGSTRGLRINFFGYLYKFPPRVLPDVGDPRLQILQRAIALWQL